MKFGELINNYPSRSRIKSQFLRESRGNYKYGVKKLNVMLEHNKILIKFGNNLFNFDDFIDKYGEEGKQNLLFLYFYFLFFKNRF
jgi:hypothetical protein